MVSGSTSGGPNPNHGCTYTGCGVRPELWTQENGGGRHLLQTRERIDQDQWLPIELVEPEILRFKAIEPILLLERHRFNGVDMRIRVKGGGHTSQIYAIRQSIAKALVAYYQKFVDEQ
ncbi:hypothetical protein SLEP1_g50154 [Rubroshorea leprosula]|uniref:Uncharacterized protein n=1 Tax=Rubroshorea leprosula TaxID=152421 RepID=A0AAV5M276_9ROSI|nr:hypothetical protein SLEP1_g50154 [Rubroshorea leprosula]